MLAVQNIQPFEQTWTMPDRDLALADSEHFRGAGWADPLGCRLLVLHDDRLRILYFLACPALHTVRFRHAALPFLT
jgi:hypothetical protein